MRSRGLSYNSFSFLPGLLLSLILFTCQTGDASSRDDFTPEEIAGVRFQNSVFNYYSKKYILSAFQFGTLLEDFPEFKKNEVVGYYLSSLSFLGQDQAVGEYFKEYKNILSYRVIFTLVNNFQVRGAYKAALNALGSVKIPELFQSERGEYYFLKARSHAALNESEEALNSLELIKNSSTFYINARLMQSRIHFKMTETKKAVRILVELLKSSSNAAEGSRGYEGMQEAAFLLGQILFEKRAYSKALSYFRRVGDGKYLPSAIEGISWIMIETGDYTGAVKKLETLKMEFPDYYYGRDLPERLLLARYYSGKLAKTEQSLKELEAFISDKEALARRIMDSEDLSKKYIYYLLENFSGIHLIEKYSLTDDDIKLFRLIQPAFDLIRLSGEYNLIEQIGKENARGLNLFNGYIAVFKKRRELFKNFIDMFRYLEPSYRSLKKTIMEIEIPFDRITAKNVKYVSTSLDMAIKEYEGKFKRPLTRLESQLVKILVYEEYISTKGLERNLPLFTLTLKMMKTLQGLYGESGNGWKYEFNSAVDEHNKSVRMINRLNSFPKLNKEVKKLKSDITSIITAYLRKEAFRIIMQNRLYTDTANAIREELLLQTSRKNDAGK